MNPNVLKDWESDWQAASAGDVDIWTEHLDRYEVADHFSFLHNKGAMLLGGKPQPPHEWMNELGALSPRERQRLITDTTRSPAERLAVVAFQRWVDGVEGRLRDCPVESVPDEGVLQYFSDDLLVCILARYRRGSAAQLGNVLAIPSPEAFFDPIKALRYARTDRTLHLLRSALYDPHKVVLHRNVLIHIDRRGPAEVFGPSIDTLVLNEWLFTNRYLAQRTIANKIYFEDVIRRGPTEISASTGSALLEVGSGNGLLTATYAKNEAMVRRFTAIDISLPAIAATYHNSYYQRSIHGGAIGDRGRFIVGPYQLDAVPQMNDLVVCNPPYVPLPSGGIVQLHPLATATLGTELLEQVVSHAPNLLAPDGVLAMVCSEMAEPELRAALPSGFTVTQVDKRRVPFDVEAVRGEHEKEIIRWLRSERNLQVERGRGSYSHVIGVYVVRSATGTSAEE